jgi:molecular chaperone HscC
MSVNINGLIYAEEYSLEQLENASISLLERFRKPVEKSLRDAKITLNDIDRIILVGGATRLPLIRSYIQKMTGIYPDYSVDPDLSVAEGASLAAAMKERREEIKEVILTDVCPFTLGTEVVSNGDMFREDGHYLPIIERNTVIPVSRTQTVYTAYDNQERVAIKVLQGESRMARNNLQIGQINLEVPKGPAGQEAIDITYTYDVNSMLEVDVKVISTGLRKKIIIQNEENRIPEEEAQARFEELKYLKQNPREDEQNIFAVLRAERIYEEVTDKDRKKTAEALEHFQQVMQTGTRLAIDKARQELLDLLDDLENKDIHGFMA